MKKISILALITVFTVLSCKESPLDITPDGRITFDEVFKDEIQTESFVNTIYSKIPLYFFNYNNYGFLAGITDEAQEVRNTFIGGMALQWQIGALTPSANPLAGMLDYGLWWQGIGHANLFLSYIDNANIEDPAKKSRLKAEVQLLRAFFYWELTKQYGAMPVVTEPFAPGFAFESLTRPSFEETVDFIVSDCDAVIANANMPLRITNASERGRFPKAVAYAIKSQALLFNASPLWNATNEQSKWQRAADAGRDALQALTVQGDFRLFDDYGNYFIRSQDLGASILDRETIHEIPADAGVFSVINTIPSNGELIGTSAGACPSQELVDSYEMQATGEPAILGYQDSDHLQPIINASSGYDENNPYAGRDPRFYATVFHNGSYYGPINGREHTVETFIGGRDQLLAYAQFTNTRTGYYLKKFYDPLIPANQLVQQTRWKKYRLAEIYLNFAEAENEANGPLGAYEAVNTVRRRADMPDLPAGLNQEQMRDRIRRERRVEFAYEEHRFWDVRRWKILSETDKLVTGIEIRKQGDGSFTYQRFVTERRSAGWQDKYLLFPIPLSETNLIPDFNNNQNPGW
ncbi:RagB/SusD family nutrient uptake outer membrane protein [Parapedobacter defluvii]|nr:RagB/SusD family nutrient uptake outer membrane protein [Parapedobacter defluvii]